MLYGLGDAQLAQGFGSGPSSEHSNVVFDSPLLSKLHWGFVLFDGLEGPERMRGAAGGGRSTVKVWLADHGPVVVPSLPRARHL
jgi:hypothetical protein